MLHRVSSPSDPRVVDLGGLPDHVVPVVSQQGHEAPHHRPLQLVAAAPDLAIPPVQPRPREVGVQHQDQRHVGHGLMPPPQGQVSLGLK